MKLALDILTVVAVTSGAFFFLAGTVGLLRFPDSPLAAYAALAAADRSKNRVRRHPINP